MNDLPSDLLLRHPELQLVLGLAFLTFASATVVLISYVVREWRRGQVIWNQLEPLPVSGLIVVGFILMLALGIRLLGGLTFPLLALGGVLAIFRALELPLDRHFGIRRLRWLPWLGLSLGISAAIYLPMQLLGVGVQKFCEHFNIKTDLEPAVALFVNAPDARSLFAVCFLAIVIAPVCEETLFRGFIQPVLKYHLNGRAALLLTAFTFAALHEHGPTLLPLFALGCILGAVYEHTGSLPLCIGLHAGFNGITAAILLGLRYYS